MDNCLEQIADNGWCLPEQVGSFTLSLSLSRKLYGSYSVCTSSLKVPARRCKQSSIGLAAQALHPLAEEAVRASTRICAGVRKTKLQPCAWLAEPGGGKVLLKLESEQARRADRKRALCWKRPVSRSLSPEQYFQQLSLLLRGRAGDGLLQGKGCLEQGMQCSISCCRVLNASALRQCIVECGACGILWQVLSLSPEELSKGLVTCSTGNHALAVLHACSWLSASQGGVQP